MLFYVNTLFDTLLQHWNTLPKGFRFPLSPSLLLPVDSPQNSLIVGVWVWCVCAFSASV